MCATGATSSAKMRPPISCSRVFALAEREQTVVKVIANVDDIVVAKVLCGLLENHAEEDAKQSRW